MRQAGTCDSIASRPARRFADDDRSDLVIVTCFCLVSECVSGVSECITGGRPGGRVPTESIEQQYFAVGGLDGVASRSGSPALPPVGGIALRYIICSTHRDATKLFETRGKPQLASVTYTLASGGGWAQNVETRN